MLVFEDGINMPSPKTASISGYKYIPFAKRMMPPFMVNRSRLLQSAFTSPYDIKSKGEKDTPSSFSFNCCHNIVFYAYHYICRKIINYLRQTKGFDKIIRHYSTLQLKYYIPNRI